MGVGVELGVRVGIGVVVVAAVVVGEYAQTSFVCIQKHDVRLSPAHADRSEAVVLCCSMSTITMLKWIMYCLSA